MTDNETVLPETDLRVAARIKQRLIAIYDEEDTDYLMDLAMVAVQEVRKDAEQAKGAVSDGPPCVGVELHQKREVTDEMVERAWRVYEDEVNATHIYRPSFRKALEAALNG